MIIVVKIRSQLCISSLNYVPFTVIEMMVLAFYFHNISCIVLKDESWFIMPLLVVTLKAPETKRQWPRRLKIFFDFLEYKGRISKL